MTEIQILPIQPDEIDEASKLISEAFIKTPFTSYVMGGNSEKHRRHVQMGFKPMISKKPGHVVVAKENRKIVGAMRMVKWPDCQNSAMKGIEVLLAALVIRGSAFKVRKFRKIWGEHDPKEAHWHIDPITVHPQKQGLGIGSILMEYFCRKVDEDGIPAYLETDQPINVRFYEKFGFKVIEEESIFSITNYYMWRDPKKV
jgi:ribosomal protein S18 acetylase RimI-like enzyme